MKFGEHLESKIREPWRSSYLDYNTIKLDMKKRQLKSKWNQSDESEFSNKIKSELIKVYTFIDGNLKRLKTRVDQQQKALDLLMSTPKASKKKYDAIADQLAEVLFDTNDLSKFHHLNLTGFEKIIKKHDRYTQLDMTRTYRQLSTQWSLEKLSLAFDVLIVKISDLHDICHLHGNPRKQQSNSDQTNFERATAKYWIHPDHITEVKSIILFHLPVHVFNKTKQYEASDMAVSSVYYDNKDFDLFSDRLSRGPGAEAIRLRWYGPSKNDADDIYVERKTHKASWLDGKSVKDRFRIKESQVNDFVAGRYTADQIADEIRKKNQHRKDVEQLTKENHFVASGVQKSMKDRKLQPTCRVFYNRTAFQLPGDQRLRISLDSNLTFIKEEGRERIAGSKELNWRRNDLGIDYPFRSVPDSDISRFPYAILETKLQTHLGQEPPAWLTNLINSHLVHEVPRFSKYLHGAAMLYPKRVPYIPHWLPKFDLDIRVAPVANIGLSRSQSLKPLVNGHHRQSLLMLYEKEQKKNQKTSGFSKSKSLGDLFSARPKRRLDDHDKPHLSIDVLGDQQQSPNSRNFLSRAMATPKSEFQGSFNPLKKKTLKEDEELGTPILKREQVDQKKISAVKKVEPKTFFANERTFISWLQFCALLLTVALNLLNNGDRISRIIGAVFIILSSVMAFYSLARYQIRTYQLKSNNKLARYDDVWGPVVLCILLVTALMINFYLRLDTLTAAYYESKSIDIKN